jgi:UDP-glucuronate 4-epimerase
LVTQIKLLDFIKAIEENLGKKAIRNYMSMQKGDVMATWADVSLLNNLTGYVPQTNFRDGVNQFIKWYREYYNI